MRKKNLSTSDLDPSERKKQAALAKVEAKLEKAQRLHQKAHQSVEQEISDFLRVTTIPTGNLETNSVRTTNATFDKRIRTLQDTKKELERKIATYQSDLSRIQAGEIPHNYTSSKDVFTNLKSTAVKVASGSLKYRSAQQYRHEWNNECRRQPQRTIDQRSTFRPGPSPCQSESTSGQCSRDHGECHWSGEQQSESSHAKSARTRVRRGLFLAIEFPVERNRQFTVLHRCEP